MTLEEFAASDGDLYSGLLRALWFAQQGSWEQAHEIAQSEDSPDAACVHAHLHRVEGDTANANYWYRRAGRPLQTGDLRAEWATLVTELLKRHD